MLWVEAGMAMAVLGIRSAGRFSFCDVEELVRLYDEYYVVDVVVNICDVCCS